VLHFIFEVAILTKNKYLLNFAVSSAGGGFKRLYEYAKWFNNHGGAWFIIHPRCSSLIVEFPNNVFFVANQFRLTRLFNDCQYLNAILIKTGVPDFYYSYGIPIYRKIGRVNWFHLSNVIPIAPHGVPMTFFDRIRVCFLGRQIKRNYINADIISAESQNSLSLIDPSQKNKLVCSVNGSDDEMAFFNHYVPLTKKEIAVAFGTYPYKCILDSYRIFKILRSANPELKLVIIGSIDVIPDKIKSDPDVHVRGILSRDDVIECLRVARIYISTTYIENSYNAASEGVFFAEESYISDIGPHQELLKNIPVKKISMSSLKRPILHVSRNDLTTENLKSWATVISDMLETVHNLSLG
jgi:hypothetical protein